MEQNKAIAEGLKLLNNKVNVKFCDAPPFFFTEQNITELLKEYTQNNSLHLIHQIGSVFSDLNALNLSFSNKGEKGISTVDSSGIDIEFLSQTYQEFMKYEAVSNAIFNALNNLGTTGIRVYSQSISTLAQLRFYVLLLHYPKIQNPDLHANFLVPLYHSVRILNDEYKSVLVNWISKFNSDVYRDIVCATQNYLVRYIFDSQPYALHRSNQFQCGTIFLGILFKANEISKNLRYVEFYNDVLNETIESDPELIPLIYDEWKEKPKDFSVCDYPFILTPLTKSQLLLFDSQEQMLKKREEAFHMLMGGYQISPYLVLQIQREHLIPSSLLQVDQVLSDSKDDFKKKLIIKFVGEEGVDQGGPQKEFFTLIIKQLFDIKYGMFIELKEAKKYWFSHTSMDMEEFKLIGVLLGLAIYNGVILDIQFPFVVYKKLMRKQLEFDDIRDVDPVVWRSLKNIAEWSGTDEQFVDVFGELTFQITTECFGEKSHINLIENGSDLIVTQSNKLQYIELYRDWILVNSVKEQFESFMEGFLCVCDGIFFKLFLAEEVELLICGETELNFDELKEFTAYDGYSEDDQVIKDFWEVVLDLSVEHKKQFLQFATGSDRSPIGGLKNLKLVITKHGEDDDRLPQSHTCFNVLLLPPYGTKEKLQNRLMTAINNSEGFGLL